MQQQILFLSFLKQSRRRDPKAWRLIILCILLQLTFIFIKLEATPFFLFGMFSEKMHTADTITVPGILVNGKQVNEFKPSLRQSQLLETTVLNYIDLKQNNNTDPVQTRIEGRYPLIYNAPFYPALSSHLYNDASAMDSYKAWLKAKCLRIAGIDSGSIEIIQTRYISTHQGIGLIKIKHETLETF